KLFGRMPKRTRKMRALPKTRLDDSAYKFPPTQRVGLVCLATARRIAQLSFFFLRRSFFAPHSRNGCGEPDKYSGSWLRVPVRHRTFLPPSPPKPFADWPNGKSYPVTAAQLLPILTGFLAPIHFSKLAKNWKRGVAACAFSVKII